MRFNFAFFLSCFPELFMKIPFTLWLGLISFVASFVLAGFITVLRNVKWRSIKAVVAVYISFFRSTPYITQLFIFYYGLPQLIPSFRTMTASTAFVISVALNTSAFLTEIIRGGLLAVDKGQKEAALSVGMSKFQMMREIILPQALVSAFPALGNALVGTVKNTAVAFTVGVVEILSESKILAAQGFNYMEAYIAAGIVYWILILFLDAIQKQAEKHANKFL